MKFAANVSNKICPIGYHGDTWDNKAGSCIGFAVYGCVQILGCG